MNNVLLVAIMTSLVAVPVCASEEYSGKGGMTKYSIKSDAYEYHYKNGFTGIDAMGWDANLQYAWSRAGAAITCGIEFDKKSVLSQMTKAYGQSDFVHELNGVDFHHMQSKKVEGFCNTSRVEEIEEVMPKLEKGQFPQYF